MGAPFSWENKNDNTLSEITNSGSFYDHIDYSYAKYVGGHPLYPKARDTGVYFYNDRIEVINPKLLIPYSVISRIENMDEKKIDRDRVVLGLLFFTPLAIHAAIKKKKHTYTVIQFEDNPVQENETVHNLGYVDVRDLVGHRNRVNEKTKTIVFDFGVDIDRVQHLVYNKMIEFKQNKDYYPVSEKINTNWHMPLNIESFEKIKSSEVQKSLQCSNCGNNINLTSSKFCTACGKELMIRCDKCDYASPGGAAYCGGCGQELPKY